MLSFNVDSGYLQEDDAFDVCQTLTNWPSSANPFVRRSAASTQVDTHGSLQIAPFVELVAQVALKLPSDAAICFDVTLIDGEPVIVTYAVAHRLLKVAPPIEADNPGFFRYALCWFAKRRPAIRLWVMQELFWVETDNAK